MVLGGKGGGWQTYQMLSLLLWYGDTAQWKTAVVLPPRQTAALALDQLLRCRLCKPLYWRLDDLLCWCLDQLLRYCLCKPLYWRLDDLLCWPRKVAAALALPGNTAAVLPGETSAAPPDKLLLYFQVKLLLHFQVKLLLQLEDECDEHGCC